MLNNQTHFENNNLITLIENQSDKHLPDLQFDSNGRYLKLNIDKQFSSKIIPRRSNTG